MNDLKINLAIAEACGEICFEPDGDMICCRQSDERFTDLQESPAAFGPTETEAALEFIKDYPEAVPNYCNDLNAMHQVEIGLPSLTARDAFCDLLKCALHYNREVVSATARQRAEAFLRALGKWKE